MALFGDKFTVLHAFKVYVPEVTGGIPEIIRLLATRLGWRSEIVVARLRGRGRSDLVDRVPVHRSTTFRYFWSMPLAPFYPLLLWRRMRQADVVDYHFPFPLVDLALALWLPRRIAVIVHWHSDVVRQKKALPYLGWLFRRTLRRADRILVSNQALIEHSPFLRSVAEKCVVVPFGVESEYWGTLDEAEMLRVEELRRRHPRLVLSVGRLVPYKGFPVLLDAMAKIDGQLIIAGKGLLGEQLEAQVAALGIGDRVLLTDYVNRSELKCLLHACNVFVLPSITPAESFGVVQLEAMAAGKPIVNTSLPTGVPWVARDGEEALTVAPGSADGLAAALSQLLDNPDLARAMGERGRARAVEQFSLDQFFARTAAVYSSVLVERRLSSPTAPGICRPNSML